MTIFQLNLPDLLSTQKFIHYSLLTRKTRRFYIAGWWVFKKPLFLTHRFYFNIWNRLKIFLCWQSCHIPPLVEVVSTFELDMVGWEVKPHPHCIDGYMYFIFKTYIPPFRNSAIISIAINIYLLPNVVEGRGVARFGGFAALYLKHDQI